jgi:RNA polymerase sigma-70 factor (ECF subfamily)
LGHTVVPYLHLESISHTMTQSDQQHLELLKSDDPASMQAVYGDLHPFVCQIISKYVSDEDTIRELAQKVFIKLWEKRYEIDITYSLSAYVRRMAINEALYFHRRKKTFETDQELLQVSDTPDSHPQKIAEASDLEAAYRKALLLLPPKCKTIFVLSREEELSYKEIATELSLSVKTVENQMGKALRVLRSALKDWL